MIYAGVFGTIDPQQAAGGYGPLAGGGLVNLINNLLGILTSLAGIFVIVNFILAGYLYLSSNGEQQKILAAGNKIVQSAVGLAVVAIAYIIAAVAGKLLFNDATILLQPKLFKL